MDTPRNLKYTNSHEWVRVEGKQVVVGITVKAASDVYAPISGTITAVNNGLLDRPELINTDPYGEGWLFKMLPDDATELESLMDADQYDQSMPDEE